MAINRIRSKKKEGLKSLYQKRIRPRVKVLQAQRDHALRKMFLINGVAAFIACAYFALREARGVSRNEAGLAFIVWGIIAYASWRKHVRPLGMKFKKEVVEKVFKALVDDCEYRPDSHISSGSFDDSHLNNSSYNTYKGEDHVKGRLGHLDFEFSELVVTHEDRGLRPGGGASGNSSRKRKRPVVRFRGLFFESPHNQNFKSRTLILDDVAERLLGKGVGRFFQKSAARSGYELVQLESTEFEKRFKVQSTDQVHARVLLTPKVMEGITKFSKKRKKKVEVSVTENRVYLMVHERSKNYFEPRYFGSIVSFKDLTEIYDLLRLFEGLMAELDVHEQAAA